MLSIKDIILWKARVGFKLPVPYTSLLHAPPPPSPQTYKIRAKGNSDQIKAPNSDTYGKYAGLRKSFLFVFKEE